MQHTSESVETLVEQFATLPTIGRKTARRLSAYVLKMSREDVEALAEALVGVKERVQRCSRCHNVTDEDPCAICASPRRDHSTICVVEESSDVQAIEGTGEYRGVYHVLGGAISPLDGVGPDDLRIRELAQRLDPAFEHASAGGGPAPSEETAAEKEAPDERTASGATASGATTSGATTSGATTSGATTSGDGAVQEAAPSYAEDASVKEAVQEVILAVNPNVEGDTTAYYLAQLLEPLGVSVTRIARGLPIGGDLEYADEATLARALEGRGGV